MREREQRFRHVYDAAHFDLLRLCADGVDPHQAEDVVAEVMLVAWLRLKAEIPQIQEWFEKFGDEVPSVFWTELDGLKSRLGV